MTLRRVATLRPAVREDVGDLKTRQAIDEGARGSLSRFCQYFERPQPLLMRRKECSLGARSNRGSGI